MNIIYAALISLIWLLIGALAGWVIAHKTIASECKRLGGFYVGDEVFDCKLKNDD